MHIFTVSLLASRIKDTLEADSALQNLWVEGEVSNFYRHNNSGHCYFTLKDDGAQLRCVMWKGNATLLSRLPTNGEAILAHGYASIYPAQGNLQLYVDELHRVGTGALFAQFEALKARLDDEGLFDEAHKRALPPFPQRIGVVTAPGGAAVRDILHVLKRRFPIADVLIAPTLVQGAEAPPQIVAALNALDTCGNCDVIIVARGGGSMEELWAFNDERVARAIYACSTPIISGVGHETDFTIADFCADVRAPTPSAAAEMAVPDLEELMDGLEQRRNSLLQSISRCVSERRKSAQYQRLLLQRASPRAALNQQRQTVDDWCDALRRCQMHQLALYREQLSGISLRLQTLDPRATLQRGYAVVSEHGTNRLITSVQQVAAGDAVDVQVHDGRFTTTVN